MTHPIPPDDIPSRYDAAQFDPALYAEWERAGTFRADAGRSDRAGGSRTPYVIVMPPPNVTGVLHMGHGLNNTVQDVLIRWRRMCGGFPASGCSEAPDFRRCHVVASKRDDRKCGTGDAVIQAIGSLQR